MNTTIFSAIAPCGSELNSILKEIVERTENLHTTVDEWMQNDEDYSDDIIRMKSLLAYGADIVSSEMGFDNHLQLGFPVLCSLINHEMNYGECGDDYFTTVDDINYPWISYTDADADDDNIGIECSFASVDEWMHYVNYYHWMKKTKLTRPDFSLQF